MTDERCARSHLRRTSCHTFLVPGWHVGEAPGATGGIDHAEDDTLRPETHRCQEHVVTPIHEKVEDRFNIEAVLESVLGGAR